MCYSCIYWESADITRSRTNVECRWCTTTPCATDISISVKNNIPQDAIRDFYVLLRLIQTSTHSLTHSVCSVRFYVISTWPSLYRGSFSFAEVHVWNFFNKWLLDSFINSMSGLSRCCLTLPPSRFAPFPPMLHLPIWISCVINYTLSLLCVWIDRRRRRWRLLSTFQTAEKRKAHSTVASELLDVPKQAKANTWIDSYRRARNVCVFMRFVVKLKKGCSMQRTCAVPLFRLVFGRKGEIRNAWE